MNNYHAQILSDIRSAQRSIKVAVSWLTDESLIQELISARRRGIDVKIILSGNELNIIRFELFQQMQQLKGVVNKWGNEEPEQGGFMHYKFYIIDDKLAKSGSYNWSINARTNKEALDDVEVNKKLREFQETYVESIDFFHEIENPEAKRAELKLIERNNNDVLTHEKLQAYRKAQEARLYQEKLEKERLEKEKLEKQLAEMRRAEEERRRKEEEQKRREAERLRKEEEERMARQREEEEVKKTQGHYNVDPNVKKPVVPPTTYGGI